MKTLLTILLILSASSLCFAETKLGLDWQYGKDSMLPTTWQSESCENTVNRLAIGLETNDLLPVGWEQWWLGVEGLYSRHKADEKKKGKYGLGHDAGFVDYGLNLTIKRQMFDKLFYAGILAGVSYWHKRDHGMHSLGDSHWLGTWGGFIGRSQPLYGPWSLKLELRATHCSDPFRADRGKNYLQSVIGINYLF